jgi:hypothetical protein
MRPILAAAVALLSVTPLSHAEEAPAPPASADTTAPAPAAPVAEPVQPPTSTESDVKVAGVPVEKSDLLSFTREELEGAIKLGISQKGRCTGLQLQDGGRAFMNALMKPSDQMGTGFSIVVYAPLEWIAQQASDAAKQYRPFTVDDVTDQLRLPVLRVVVHPDMPHNMTARGRATTSSVQHVVLRDDSKQIVAQPVAKEPFEEEASNALGAHATYMGLRATFSIDDLAKVRGPNGDGEFFVTVVGDGTAEKNFKVKTKHFAHLNGTKSVAQK